MFSNTSYNASDGKKRINIIAQSVDAFRMEMKNLKVGMCELARFEVWSRSSVVASVCGHNCCVRFRVPVYHV